MKKFTCIFIMAFSLLVFSWTSAKAAVIYSTFGSGQTYGSFGWLIGSEYPNWPGEVEQIAAPFTPAINATLDSIDFAAYYVGGPNQLTVNLETDASGVPSNTVIESFDFTNLSTEPAVYTANSLLHPHLTASTEYWVVLTAQDLVYTGMAWMTNNQGIVGCAAQDYAIEWQVYGVPTPAFDVVASNVPEPSTLILAGAGLFALAITTSRKRL